MRNFFTNSIRVQKEDREMYKYLKRFSREHIKDADDYYVFGYETFGIILYGFCRWMMADLEKKGISQILFFSRDGYIIKKAFESIPGHEKFNTKYMYASRRSLRVPLLWKENRATVKGTCPTKYISLGDYLNSLGLDPLKYSELVRKYDFSLQTVIEESDIETDEKLVLLLEKIWKDVSNLSREEYKSLECYLNQFETEKDVAVVDIGWRGSLQYFLEKMLFSMGRDTHLHGYYVNLSSSMIKGIDLRGYLHDLDGSSHGCDEVRGYAGLIELLFLKSEGSVEKYERGADGNIQPKLLPYEYMDENGEYTKECILVRNIQAGALQFIRDIVASNIELNYSSQTAFINLTKFANHPKLRNLEMFAGFRFYNNGSVSYLAKARPLGHYLLHPGDFKTDFYGCRWRIGFMKNLLKVPLPYYRIFKTIMKITLH